MLHPLHWKKEEILLMGGERGTQTQGKGKRGGWEKGKEGGPKSFLC